MSVFSTRPAGYKFGLVALYVCAGLYIIGFGAPYWTVESVTDRYGDEQQSSVGLWMACVSAPGYHTCASLTTGVLQAWFHVVRTLAVAGLIVLCISCLHGMAINCCRTTPQPLSRSLEVWSFIGGFLGLLSTVIFFGRMSGMATFGWAIFLSTVGSAGAIVLCFVIGCNNRATATPATAARVITLHTVEGQQAARAGVVIAQSHSQAAYSTTTGAYGQSPYAYGQRTNVHGPGMKAGYEGPATVYHVPEPQGGPYPPAYAHVFPSAPPQ